MRDFDGKTAVITGGASGIGLAMGELFAAHGMNIVLADIEQGALDLAVARLEGQGANCIGVVTDVSDAEQVGNLASQARERFGDIHIACNNAGVVTGGLLWEEPLADYEWLMNVNIMGVVHGIRTFTPIMIEQDCDCHIVNTASMVALTSNPYLGIYHMTKHAVLSMSECFYHELVLHAPKVKVSVLCPEVINTGIAASARNRPDSNDSVVPSDGDDTVMEGVKELIAGGIGPEVMAQRVLDGIREERFYLLSEEEWREVAHIRLDDIREGRNPTLASPEIKKP